MGFEETQAVKINPHFSDRRKFRRNLILENPNAPDHLISLASKYILRFNIPPLVHASLAQQSIPAVPTTCTSKHSQFLRLASHSLVLPPAYKDWQRSPRSAVVGADFTRHRKLNGFILLNHGHWLILYSLRFKIRVVSGVVTRIVIKFYWRMRDEGYQRIFRNFHSLAIFIFPASPNWKIIIPIIFLPIIRFDLPRL